MNIWPVIFIVLAIALVVGPVMMFKPSRRDRQLATLRQSAALEGVVVRLRELEVSGEKQAIAEYFLPFHDKRATRNDWLLIQHSFTHELHFSQHWTWENSQKQAATDVHRRLKDQISTMPESILGVGATSAGVYLLWRERGVSVEEVLQRLTTLREMC